MAAESELNEQISQAYHAVMRDGTVAAIGREAVKDVRSTLMEVFFGKGERGSEPGTPLNPLFYDMVAARNTHSGHAAIPQKGASVNDLPSPSEIIADPQSYLPEQSQGSAVAIEAAPDMGNDAGSMPTPSEIIADPQAYLPEQPAVAMDHGYER